MKPRVLRGRALIAVVAVALMLALHLFRLPVLTGLGRLLVSAAPPVRAEVLVVMRGDETYFERTLTAAALFRAGYGSLVYVSSALDDFGGIELRRKGLHMPSAQENIASLLVQEKVPCDSIILDSGAPGGGTVGEAERLAAMMTSRKLTRALVVTSWFHTRRTKWVMDNVLGKSGKTATVVLADSPIGLWNWWTRRYTAILVLEEFIKLGLYGVFGRLTFSDDPSRKAAESNGTRIPADCPQTR